MCNTFSIKWKFFQEDDSGPEAVPNIVVASEKDAVITSPQIVRLWEKMSLEPYDQPKDVLYIGVVPDNLICIEKTKKYLIDLSMFIFISFFKLFFYNNFTIFLKTYYCSTEFSFF